MAQRRAGRRPAEEGNEGLDRPGLTLPDPPADWGVLPPAAGAPLVAGRLRASPEDFQVVEDLGFGPSGDGDHLMVRLRKRGANTEWVARRLATILGVSPAKVSYAGLKDRHAVTEQSFSVHLPGKHLPDLAALEGAGITLLEVARNRRMVRRGGLKGNRFTLVLRDLRGLADGGAVPTEAIEARLALLARQGTPNYFGEQRFGQGGGNLTRALALFAGEREPRSYQRGLYVSAARGYLFNQVLGDRVRRGLWDQALPGEALCLEGSRSYFVARDLDESIARRLAAQDVHPSGPLWGQGPNPAEGEALALELAALADHGEWRAGLEAYGARLGRRALRVQLRDLAWRWLDPRTLELSFGLPPGAYATAALREVAQLEGAADAEEGAEGGGEEG